jgi:hypothetical protein
MLFRRTLLCFLFLPKVNLHLQINLHLTGRVSESNDLQHDCLNFPAYIENENDPRQIISYYVTD